MIPATSGVHVGVVHPLLITAALMVLFFSEPVFSALSPDDTGCIRWRDTLIVAGVRSLEHRNAAAAERYFTAAYECGMSKDSMCYFAAEMYLCRFMLDTALVFNKALEKSPTFSNDLRTAQRARIYRFLGGGRQADSLRASSNGENRFEASLSFIGIRSNVGLNKFLILPQKIPIAMDPDTEDIGKTNFRFRWSRPKNRTIPPLSATFDMNSDVPLLTRYFLDEATDTLMQHYGFSAGIGDLREMPELTVGYRLRLHDDGKVDHYSKVRFSVLLSSKWLLTGGHDAKWVHGEGLDEGREEVSLLSFISGNKCLQSWGITLSHRFLESFMYSSRVNSKGIFRPLPLGFIDSLTIGDTSQPYYRLYRDRHISDRYIIDENLMLPNMFAYWDRQPDIYFITLPEHDINASLKYGYKVVGPHYFSLTLNGSLQGTWYPKKVGWFYVKSDTLSNGQAVSQLWFDDLYNECAMVYNGSNGKYYLNRVRTDLRYIATGLTELSYHEKTRIDGYFVISASLEKMFGVYGTVFISGTFSKGLSTMKQNEPVITFDHGLEFTAGWKKDLVIHQ